MKTIDLDELQQHPEFLARPEQEQAATIAKAKAYNAANEAQVATPSDYVAPVDSLPLRLKREAVDYWSDVAKQGGAAGATGKLMGVLASVAPETWTEAAALGVSLIPGLGTARLAQQAGKAIGLVPKVGTVLAKYTPGLADLVTGQIGAPILAGAATGAITGEGTESGAKTGLITGTAGKLGGALAGFAVQELTGYGKTISALGHGLYKRFGDKFGGELAESFGKAIPSLGAAKVPLRSSEDVRALTEITALRKVGKLFDKIEDEIAADVKVINMPISRTETEVTGLARTARKATGTRTASSKSVAQGTVSTKADPYSDTLISKEAIPAGDEESSITRIRTSPGSSPGKAVTSASEATRKTEVSGTSQSTNEAEMTRAAKSTRLTSKDFVFRPMPAKDAITRMKEYRTATENTNDFEAKSLYHAAEDAVMQAIHDSTLADRYSQLRSDYRKLMQVHEGLIPHVNAAFPGTPGETGTFHTAATAAGGGINPQALYDAIRSRPDLFGYEEFAPVHQFFEGAARGGGPHAIKLIPPGAYVHGGLPASFRVQLGKAGPGTELPPKLAAVLVKRPELAKLLNDVIGARYGGRVMGLEQSRAITE